ncbi:MAG: 1,6-anhydro-N-acetylmuramyl-L-alanine amidase AmpD [Enterobacterales bacterium]|nr:1,6-anhydro-N-acetylmuramyl-L-alanine amidase AmpD [Enterobacterales bacterium]
MAIIDGILSQAKSTASSHYNQRPNPEDISLLVIHNISLPPGDFNGQFVEQFFCGKLDFASHPSFADLENLKVSSHLFIRRDGELIQFVNLNDRAWHAGVSEFEGRENCNDYSIGIELEGTDFEAFTELQYKKLSQVTLEIMHNYPKITNHRICGHSDIARGRKTDPGPFFDWGYYRKLMNAGLPA